VYGDAPSAVDVVAGIYNLQTPADGYQRRDVTQIVVHSGYSPSGHDFDIALLKLSSPVTLGGSGETAVDTVPLVSASVGSLAGTTSWVTGWGNTESVPLWPTELQEVEVPIQTNTLCNDVDHYNGSITSNMLCAGLEAGGKDSCQGDSGGPLVVWNGTSSRWELAGIVSWGTGCADPAYFGVYTRVSEFVAWVNANIPPDAPVLIGPEGDIGTNYSPTYQWYEAERATEYLLYIVGPSGPVISKWYPAASVCSGGECSVVSNTMLNGGTHTMEVLSYNSGGYTWSAKNTFYTTPLTKPDGPTLIGPVGDIGANYNPTFEWNEVVGAREYYLYVVGPSGPVITKWFQASSVCTGGVCSVPCGAANLIQPACTTGECDVPVTKLAGGTHTMEVMSYNPAGYTWSAKNTFNTAPITKPAAPVLDEPDNGEDLGTNYTPTYQWNDVFGATEYYLYVVGPSGPVISKWFQDADYCNGVSCSVPSSTALGGGTYTMEVLSYNSVGYTWSLKNTFYTTPPTKPAGPVLEEPDNGDDLGTNYSPVYQWQEAVGATEYYLYVVGPGGPAISKSYSAASICSGGMCSVTSSTTLGGGTHTMEVMSYNSAGYTWSAKNTFYTTLITKPDAPPLIGPVGDIGAVYNPTYEWTEVDGAAEYYLYVVGPGGPVISKWYQAANVCSGGTCSVTPSTTLGGGTHTMEMLSYNSAGYTWSAKNTFSTTPFTKPAAPNLIGPTGYISSDYNPTYRWSEVSGATEYYLYVVGPSGAVVSKWYQAANVCSGGTCSARPGTTLGGGAHTMEVLSYNPAGYTWSSKLSFSTKEPLKPAAATLIGPSGSVPSYAPTYQWSEADMATWYYLYLVGPDGAVTSRWYQAYNICVSGTCAIPSDILLNNDSYTWWLLPWNVAGYGAWSNEDFTVSATGIYSQFNGSTAGWEVHTGTWSNSSNAWYTTQGLPNFKYASTSYNATYSNLDFQARVKTDTVDGEGYLMVRGDPTSLNGNNDWNNSYSFGFDNTGFFSVWKRQAGVLTALSGGWLGGGNFTPNGWNVIRVVADGSHLYYYINGIQVWDGIDATFASGRVGIEFAGETTETLWVDWATLSIP
jgi:hypothetical protein